MAEGGDHNGNGRVRSAVATITPAVVGTVLLGGIFAALGQGYEREQDEQAASIKANRDGITELNRKREDDAYQRGRIDQTLVQLGELGSRQRDRIEQVGADLDSSLQREMRTLDEAMLVQIRDLDGRIQAEITRSADADREAMAVLRHEVERLRRDWERFEDQMGIKRTLP